jgi:hypothetical protein
VVHEPIDGCRRLGLVGETLAHLPDRWLAVRSRIGVMAGGDHLEHHTGLDVILGDVGDLVEDQQVVLVELGVDY